SAYASPLGASLIATARHPVPESGLTHASIVIPVVRWSDGESAIVTHALLPLKYSALPNLPDVLQVALEIVPVLPWPEASPTWTPLPSLNPYAATSPVGLLELFDT